MSIPTQPAVRTKRVMHSWGDHKRLAVDTGDGKVQLYDTGDHSISGVRQHHSGSGRKVMFTSQHGEEDLATLKPA